MSNAIKTLLILAIAGFMLCPLFFIYGGAYDPQALMQKFTSPEAEEFSRSYVERVRAHQFGALAKDTDPKILDAQFPAKIRQVADVFPKEEPKSIKVIGSHSVTTRDETLYDMVFEYEFPHGWTFAELTFHKQQNFLVERLDVEPMLDSAEHANRFTFEGKGERHYLVFAFAIMLLLANLYVLTLCIQSQALKKKWLVALLILLGICQVSFNWTTGEFSWSFLYIGIPIVQFFQAPYGPMMLHISVPLWAIIFFYKYPRGKS